MTRAGAVALVVLLTSGCSFIVVDGPGTPRPGLPPSCTTTPIAPVVDTGLAVLGVVGAVTAHTRLDQPEGGEFPNNDFLRMQRTFSIIGGVLFAASATVGFVKTTKCRRARSEYRERALPPGTP